MSASACADAARRYASLGWSLVVLEPNAKRPLAGRPWTRAQRERADVGEVLQLLAAHPGANLGLVAGSVSGGTVALDLDEPGPPPVALPAGPVVETATPGHEHCYFAAARPVPTAMHLFGRKIELRGERALLVLPPSIVDGRTYTWRGDPAGGLPALPAEILRAAQAATKRIPMALLLRGVLEGARNIAAARVAGFYLHRCATREEAWAATVAWNGQNLPPLDSAELRGVFESILGRYQRQIAPHSLDPAGRGLLEKWVLRHIAREREATVWRIHRGVGGNVTRDEVEGTLRTLVQRGAIKLAGLTRRGAAIYRRTWSSPPRTQTPSQTPRREPPEPSKTTTPLMGSTLHTLGTRKDEAKRPPNHSHSLTLPERGPGSRQGAWDGRVTAPAGPAPKIEQVWRRLPSGELQVWERGADGTVRLVGWSVAGAERDGEP